IPIPWIGLVLCMVCCIQNKIMPFSKILYLMILLILILIITTFINYEENSAPLSFIALRFLNIIAFLIILNYFAYQKYKNHNFLYLEKNIINIGLFFSIVAILLFFIHMLNLQEINFIDQFRNRLTTGAGKEYPTMYNFNFDQDNFSYYRSNGTFREPSLLVNALILPLFLSIKNQRYFSTIIIGISIYMTYSLAILIAMIFGIIFSLLVIYKKKILLKNSLLFMLLSVFLAYLLFKFGNIFSNVYVERLIHLGENNSRDYIYQNLDIILGDYWTGNGIGYGFFKLAEHMFGSSAVPVSFLSLPLNIWSAGGILSLIIIIFLISYHNISTLMNFNNFNRNLYLLITPLNVFLILYFSSFEELHIWHAITLGMYLSYLADFNKKNIKKQL
ncbi:hypothetical protein OA845_03525, partial [Candidatus Pelagibacter sp.]|nr:hypothetical protein [Candidatus Pelagibacter sp.]